MSAEIYEWSKHVFDTREGGGSGGPEDPVLEQRVAAIEAKLVQFEFRFDKIEEALRRIEVALRDLAQDNKEFRKQLSEGAVKMALLEGRLQGMEGRLSNVPTTWQTIAIMATLMAGLSGILFTAARIFHP